MQLVIHTRLLFWAQGMAVAPWLILIQPTRRGDEALLAHERCHCDQQRKDGTLRFWWNYATSPAHRQAYEVEAYRISVSIRPEWIDSYADALATEYRLPLTAAEAKKLLA